MPRISHEKKQFYKAKIRSLLSQDHSISGQELALRLETDGITLERHYLGKLTKEIYSERTIRADRKMLSTALSTWGIPGGAIRQGETAQGAAQREVEEELGVSPEFQVAVVDVQECGGGRVFHIMIADVDHCFPAYCVRETDATGWFTYAEMNNLLLHPGLRSWLDQVNQKGNHL